MLEIDARILAAIEEIKLSGVYQYDKEIAEKLGMKKQNLSLIRKQDGVASFTVEQIYRFCKTFKYDANFIMGITKSRKMLNSSSLQTLDQS